jgi:hypothetical protein
MVKTEPAAAIDQPADGAACPDRDDGVLRLNRAREKRQGGGCTCDQDFHALPHDFS